MFCRFRAHIGEHPDAEFWLREDGKWIHEVSPTHTAEGRLIFDSTDAVDDDLTAEESNDA